LRKKIEHSTEKIRAAKLKEEQARKVFIIMFSNFLLFSLCEHVSGASAIYCTLPATLPSYCVTSDLFTISSTKLLE